MNIKLISPSVIAVFCFALLSLQIDTSLSLSAQIELLLTPSSAASFAEIFFVDSQLPRLAMAILVGSMLGLVGSLMQQLTQNNLTSPLTLGSSSGAWLALVAMNVWFIDYVAEYSALAAMVGSLVAFGLIVAIAGIKNMTGLPLVVSGMVINILLGSIAAAIVVLNSQFAQNVFMARILAIDYGMKRTGIAVTDELQIIASGLITVNTKELIEFLKDYMAKENVELFLVGEPKQMDNTASESEALIQPFLVILEKQFPKTPIVRVDERFTSKMAFQTMIDSGLKKQQRKNKALIDEISATLILQSYLYSQ